VLKNPLTCADGYKQSHRQQYPAGTSMVYSNLTPRSDRLKNIPDDLWTGKVTFFGLQYFLKEFLQETWDVGFFQRPKREVVLRFKRRMDAYLGKDAVPTDHIEQLHDLGYLPICIKALPEGCQVPMKTPVLVLYNTHEDFAWLTNFLETALSAYLWKPTTSATVARHYRLLLKKYADETCDSDAHLNTQAHDFSMRGLSGLEDGAMSGAGHLTSFIGTDSICAIDLVESYYNADVEQEVVGVSVPATEHSVATLNIFNIEESLRVNGSWNGINLEDL